MLTDGCGIRSSGSQSARLARHLAAGTRKRGDIFGERDSENERAQS